MRSKIQRCRECRLYTLREVCPSCGGQAITTKPARYSPEDPYGRYRRALASQEAK